MYAWAHHKSGARQLWSRRRRRARLNLPTLLSPDFKPACLACLPPLNLRVSSSAGPKPLPAAQATRSILGASFSRYWGDWKI